MVHAVALGHAADPVHYFTLHMTSSVRLCGSQLPTENHLPFARAMQHGHTSTPIEFRCW